MKVVIPIAVAAITVSTASGATAWIDGLTKSTNSDSYHMKHVHMVHARVQSDAPLWNASTNTFGSSYYKTADEQFRGLLDTVNTASVEGALMYVQAEGIDVTYQSTPCVRKNKMKYVVFYDIVFAQTNETLAEYEAEYGPFLAMDGGRCNQVNGTESEECLSLNGNATLEVPNVGPFVGGSLKETDARAPYQNCWWYSFPNSCPLQPWGASKTAECRASTRQGLCDMNALPDGINCTYNYRVLGYVPLDDVVGITSIQNNANTGTYANYTEFCADGGHSVLDKPADTAANTKRAQTLLKVYGDMLTNKKSSQIASDVIAHMNPLPAWQISSRKTRSATQTSKNALLQPMAASVISTARSALCATLLRLAARWRQTRLSSHVGEGHTDRILRRKCIDWKCSGSDTPTPASSAASLVITVSALIASFGFSILMG
ncbi:hypothetical protein GQ600_17005 [Phytophthora cactorum]|nr:hypothetical protein GQ600_17005 [Phytophthora cactorum]